MSPKRKKSDVAAGAAASTGTAASGTAAAAKPPAGPQTEANSYDYIVVGGGTGACAVAGRLSENSAMSVFLIERGRDETNNPNVKPTRYTLEDPPVPGPFLPVETFFIPDPTLALTVQKGYFVEYSPKAWGGGPAVSGSFWGRGDPTNYDEWVTWAKNDPSWGYNACLPFFKITETVFSIDNRFPISPERGQHGPIGAGALDTAAASNKPFLAAFNKTFACTSINDSSTSAGQFGISPMVRSLGLDVDKPVRNSSYVRYVEPYLAAKAGQPPNPNERKNIHTLDHATVTRILFDNSGAGGALRAIGIEYLLNAVTQVAYARKEIIIGAGTINSAKILLQSGVGPADHLKEVGIPVVHNLPGVGRNMTEHTAVTFRQLINPLVLPKKVPIEESGANIGFLKSAIWDTTLLEKIEHKVQVAAAGIASKVVTAIGSAISKAMDDSTGKTDTKSDTAAAAAPKPAAPTDSGPGFTPLPPPSKNPLIDIELSYCLAGLSDILPIKNMLIGFIACVRNDYRGTVKLTSVDPLQPPAISYQTFYPPEQKKAPTDGFDPFATDFLKLVNGMKMIRKWLYDTDLCVDSELNVPNAKGWTDLQYGKWIQSLITGLYHWAGTCKMGPASDTAAVVDSELRVHGISNLRVADCSVMPIVVSTHPSATATMIGEKCAYFIQGWSKHADPKLAPKPATATAAAKK